MKCIHCGASNSDEALFCQKCGKRLDTTGQDEFTVLSPSSTPPVSISTPQFSEQQGKVFSSTSVPVQSQIDPTQYAAFPPSSYDSSPHAAYKASEPISSPPPPPDPLYYRMTNPYESQPPLITSKRKGHRGLWIVLALIALVIITISGTTWLVLSKTSDLVQRATLYSGLWLNDDPNTNDIPKLEISNNGQTLTVHGYGACTPVYCDWGTRSGTFNGDPFIIVFDFGDGNIHTLTISLENVEGTRLKVVDDGTHSGITTDFLHKQGY